MTHEFDLVQSLAVGTESRGDAWQFIREFVANWAEPLGDDDGWTEADLVAAEERLGVQLPRTLRDGYLLFGRRRDLTRNHDVLLSPSELHVDDSKEALVFRHENQGAASWGILLEALGEEDPAVFIRADLADKTAERWEGWLERLSLALIDIVLSEFLQADDEYCDFLDVLDDQGIEALERVCTRLPFPAYPLCEAEPGIRWFLGDDVLVRDDGGMAVLARGRTEEGINRIRDLVPGDWLNDPR
ncbi:SMI1/KNR4 family protein [Streptomyces sp. NPDC018352]|uniref:SMI1/KNR4 family protein n=1 Tax=Streptomyces sp. NPDC018352 TaxID=3157194 RepID=UPI0033F257A4